jgi:hypothetical protein
MDNPAVIGMSILSYFENLLPQSNTMRSVDGVRQNIEGVEMPENERLVLSFALVSLMQVLFLCREGSEQFCGYDIAVKEQRDAVLDLLIDNMFGRYA